MLSLFQYYLTNHLNTQLDRKYNAHLIVQNNNCSQRASSRFNQVNYAYMKVRDMLLLCGFYQF